MTRYEHEFFTVGDIDKYSRMWLPHGNLECLHRSKYCLHLTVKYRSY